MSSNQLTLELLDSDATQALQSWEFEPPAVIQIGRSRDCEVAIPSPYVSRAHAYVHPGPEGWELTSVSSHGIVVDGRKRESLLLVDGATFRLGSRGPVMRSRLQVPAGTDSTTATLAFDAEEVCLLMLNEQERDSEVQAIVDNEYFQKLIQAAAALRSPSD